MANGQSNGSAEHRAHKTTPTQASLPDDHRTVEPPDPLPNSEVKRSIADGSVVFRHVRVGHRQASIPKAQSLTRLGLFHISESVHFVTPIGTPGSPSALRIRSTIHRFPALKKVLKKSLPNETGAI